MKKVNVFETRLEKIGNILNNMNSPPYRFEQVKQAIYNNGIESYSEISTLSKDLREVVIEKLGDKVLSLTNIYEMEGGQAQKILFETTDRQRIETVRMLFKPTDERDYFHSSLCISSQSGCVLACKFCATGAIGFKKNLTADEIADQVLYFKQKKLPAGSVSFMGMGEPFANPNLWEAIKILTDKDKIGISRHKISVSTVGLVPGIERLTKEFPQINLAFSLHTPFSDQRAELMPITKAYSIETVMESVKKYVLATNNKVFIAYALMEGTNDSLEHAKALVSLIKKQGAKSYLYHVNLIRFNPGPGTVEFKRPSVTRVDKFMEIIEKAGIRVTLRQSFGLDIYAACGQLYGKYENN
ncbi:hypothetical protein A3B64_00035 [candidate division WWE3 bacterium RIFCSPLOWO2_01_FULL_37_24]|uniref:Radical SAM core domain-containing protein n=1 Tax=candidate division WWE3 bacterium RIFCSPHIGHO2_02_FULL_38_14 TaxID=1802620 RepID=A0A1F4V7N5_UNCKA|nr:MAG: hypothetical protein A3B64_00035 [candidate division WWE3 bacterium RIFCSPLOWO2_01_FULL_37_24]OGC52990.1 MAG: hypothetical protein A3D91_01595 [candidate division WWE3 bacterium RIFCSPHIGHO2_02_FULL_38_14]